MHTSIPYRSHAVDIHSHIVMNVDDGSSSLEESLALLQMIHADGISVVFATPHYGEENGYKPSARAILENFEQLQKAAGSILPEMSLYLGTEWYCAEDAANRIRNQEAFRMNHTDYALVEFLEYGEHSESAETILNRLLKLRSEGIRPILAHAERYRDLQQHWEVLDRICAGDILLQVNAFDICLNQKQAVRDLTQHLLKNRMVSFIGSDMHGLSPKREPMMKAGIDWIYDHTDREYADGVIRKNAERYLGVKQLSA